MSEENDNRSPVALEQRGVGADQRMRPRALSRGQARRRSATGSIMTGVPGRPVVAGTVASSAVVDAPVRTPATRPAPARFAHMERRNRHGESGSTLAAVERPSQIARVCPKRAVRLRHHRIAGGEDTVS